MESAGEEATHAQFCEIYIKQEPVQTDSYQQPLQEIEQIYIKEENAVLTEPYEQPLQEIEHIDIKEGSVKVEIHEESDAIDPLQLNEEELNNGVGSRSHHSSEPHSIIPTGVENASITGGSGDLVAGDVLPTRVGNVIQGTINQQAACEIDTSSHLELGCGICKKTFADLQAFREHKHLYSCSKCDQKFTSGVALSNHSRAHVEKRVYICEVCHKVFTFRSKLKIHSRQHTGECPYTCDVCFKSFREKHHLESHARQHTGETPYSCTLCEKKFANRSALRIHVRVHTGDRPHTCEYCQKTFTQISVLKIHLRIHTGEKPYSCTLCDKKFAQKSSLKSHFAVHNKRPLI